MTAGGRLEWQAYREVEGEVAAKARMYERIMVALGFVGRVDGFHTEVETQYEVVEIESDAQSVGHGKLAQERAEAKLSAGLVAV